MAKASQIRSHWIYTIRTVQKMLENIFEPVLAGASCNINMEIPNLHYKVNGSGVETAGAAPMLENRYKEKKKTAAVGKCKNVSVVAG